MPGPLDDLVVLDLTQYVAGPYATKLLADYGADVVKVERPGGDPIRRFGPFQGGTPHPEKSGSFAYLNTNKRSLELDLRAPGARDVILRLVDRADLVVENFAPGTMDDLGLGWETLQARKPSVSLLSISNFGHDSPYRDYKGSELVLYGFGGELYSIGIPAREPVKMFGTAALIQSGGAAACAAMGAFFSGRLHGIGQWVDFALVDAHLISTDRRSSMIMAWEFGKKVGLRSGAATVALIGGVYPCADGFVEFTGASARPERLATMFGHPEWLRDPKWLDPAVIANPDLRDEFAAHVYEWCAARTKREIWAEARRARVLCGPLFTIDELLDDPASRERGFWAGVDHPVMGHHELPGRPFILPDSPWELRRPAPLLGQHSREILADLGYPEAEIDALLRTSRVATGVTL